MTTIVGFKTDHILMIAADNQVTDDNGRKFFHPRMAKIVERGQYLIAGSGEVAPCDIAQTIWKPPVPTANDKKDPYNFMITKAMPSLRKCLKENGFNFDEPKESSRFNLLIAVGGELFDVDDELAVMMSEDGMHAIGSGGQYALGALHAGATALEALAIAAKLNAYTGGEFIIKSQQL